MIQLKKRSHLIYIDNRNGTIIAKPNKTKKYIYEKAIFNIDSRIFLGANGLQ